VLPPNLVPVIVALATMLRIAWGFEESVQPRSKGGKVIALRCTSFFGKPVAKLERFSRSGKCA